MKYNVFNLKVIKVKTNDKSHYFICKSIAFSKTYTEIFTRKKITVKDDSCVKPLSNYFSTPAICNPITRIPLMLSKQDLLTKYIEINNYYNSKQNEDNPFGDKNYQMKDTYNTDNLVVAKLQRISSTITELGPKLETTKQKYIFEILNIEGKTKYQEIFTGFIAASEEEVFDLIYAINPIPFTHFFPEIEEKEIPKLSLLWAINDINYPKIIELSKRRKR